MLLVLRYVLKAYRKEGELSFSRCASGHVKGKSIKKDNGASLNTLKEIVTLPTQEVYQPKVSRHPLPRFVSCSKTLLKEEEDFPNV